MDTATRLEAANTEAQARFHTMLVAEAFSDPEDPRTKAWVAAERLVDSIMVDAQWEKAKTELDRLQAIDLEELAKGDHYLRPAEAGR